MSNKPKFLKGKKEHPEESSLKRNYKKQKHTFALFQNHLHQILGDNVL